MKPNPTWWVKSSISISHRSKEEGNALAHRWGSRGGPNPCEAVWVYQYCSVMSLIIVSYFPILSISTGREGLSPGFNSKKLLSSSSLITLENSSIKYPASAFAFLGRCFGMVFLNTINRSPYLNANHRRFFSTRCIITHSASRFSGGNSTPSR